MDALIAKARSLLQQSIRPVFLFDDDVDGLCSYLILRKYVGYGKGILLKSSPKVSSSQLRRAEENNADLVVILDKSSIDEEFIERCKIPILWIDHHEPQEVHGITYVNPLLYDKNPLPTSFWAYKIAEEKYTWLAEVGCVADWQLDDALHKKAVLEYPDLISADLKEAQDILFDSKLGVVCHILLFNLKGASPRVRHAINLLEEIETPEELLNQSSKQATQLFKHYEIQKEQYDAMYNDIISKGVDEKLIVYQYTDAKTSYTAQLSNKLLHEYPKSIIVIARLSNGQYKCSLRCSPPLNLRDIVAGIINNVEGYAGGHEQALGACIEEYDFNKFLALLKEGIM